MKKIGIKILSIVFIMMSVSSVYGAEPVLQVMSGQTVIEDMCHPNMSEIEEAEIFLSENHVDVPAEIEAECEAYGKMYNIAPELLEAIIWKESRFKPEVVSATGTCKGLMQINTGSHSKRMARLGVTDIFDVSGNILVGTDYLAELLQENDVDVAIMLYNGDKRAYEDGYQSSYVKKILNVSQALERKHYR